MTAFVSYAPTAAKLLASIIIAYLIATAVYNRFFHPLSKYPGPWLASISKLWYWRTIRYAVAENNQRALHEKYGQWVRITPDQIAVSDIAAQDIIYGSRGTKVFIKADFYDGFAPMPPINHRIDTFSERDPVKHAERRRVLAPLYTQSAALSYEPSVDRVLDLLVQRMNAFAASVEAFDISVWFHKYAFDVIGEIFYGKEGGFGMIRDDVDYNSWLLCMKTMPGIGASKSFMPILLQPIWMMWEVLGNGAESRTGLWGMLKVVQDAKRATKERIQQRSSSSSKQDSARSDMLTKLLDLADNPDVKWTSADVSYELWSVIWAGSDTTATTLCSILYHLHKNRPTLTRLRKELDLAVQEGDLRLPIRYSEAHKLPYLNAVVSEAMRIHPALGFGLPRIVPEGGAEICGRWFPAGTTIIMNANVVHFDKGVFGEDADDFNPDRWLDDEERSINMARHVMSFGIGTRTCVGKHISRIEMFKLIPSLLLQFDFEFDDPAREWKIYHGWFQQQSGIFMKVKRR